MYNIVILILFVDVVSQIGGQIDVKSSDYTVQQKADYTIKILTFNSISANQTIYITFSTEYQSQTETNYSCDILDSPINPVSLQCSLTFRVLKITGGFPQNISDVNEFSLILRNISNPLYSGTTGQFKGQLKNSNGINTQSLQGNGISIISGNLKMQMQASSDIVDDQSTLKITVTPSHYLTSSSWIQFITDIYWQAIIVNIKPIIVSSKSLTCTSLNNTKSNLYCELQSTSNNKIINIRNLFDTDNIDPFTFSISFINNPLTLQPQGNFKITSYYSTISPKAVDTSSNNKLTVNTPKSITNTAINMDSLQIDAVTRVQITMSISSIIGNTDVVCIEVPSQIFLQINSIQHSGKQLQNIKVNNSLFQFEGLTIQSDTPTKLTINNFKLPPYVVTLTNFSIKTTRNTFLIDSIQNAFTITTLPGSINATVKPIQTQAGIITPYKININTEHNILSNYKLLIQFSSQFNINNSISCTSTASTTCSIDSVSANIITISNLVSSTTKSVTITIISITNPYSLGEIVSLKINTITDQRYIVDEINTNVTFVVESRKLSKSNITIISDNYKVYAICNINISVANNNPIPAGSYMEIVIPTQLILPNPIICNKQCTLVQNTTNRIKIININEMPNVFLSSIRNPISTKPTQSFEFWLYNSFRQVLEYIMIGINYQVTKPTQLSIAWSRNSTINRDTNVAYSFTLGLPFDISDQLTVTLEIPVHIKCPLCLKISLNTTHYTILYSGLKLTTMKQLTFAQNGITNFYSLKLQNIGIILSNNDRLYQYAVAQISVINTDASNVNFNKTFTHFQLKQNTNLSISNISLETLEESLSVKLIFGTDFSLDNILCNPLGYSCNVTKNEISLQTNGSTLTNFEIQLIGSPSSSPSTFVTLSIFADDYLVAENTNTIQWSTICDNSCRTCPKNNITQCLSCYTDPFLVANRIFLYPINNTCVVQCGQLYYEDENQICKSCSSICENCVNQTLCTSCLNSSYLFQLNKTCVTECPQGYFKQNNRCLVCTQFLNCLGCSNESSCLSCSGIYYLYQTKCLIDCPSPITITNTFTNICQSCPLNCTACAIKSTNLTSCSICQNGFLLDNGACYQICRTPNTVQNGIQCTACDQSCLTCANTVSNCLSCNISSIYPYFHSNRCLKNCSNGYYQQTSLYVCLQCTKPCQYCINSSIKSCISCISGFSLLDSICSSTCPSGFYENATNCQNCIHPCFTCLSATICMTCAENYSLFTSKCLIQCNQGYVSVNQICVGCSSNCRTCELINYCSSCFNGTYLHNGTCLKPCPSHYYEVQIKLICIQCHYSCKQCLNQTYCTFCEDGYDLDPNFSCLSSCAKGLIPVDSICTLCSENCSSCQQNIQNCTACKVGFYYIILKNICSQNCLAPLVILQSNVTCLFQCPERYFIQTNTRKCKTCPQFCSECLLSTQCSTCDSGASMYQSLCYQVCPDIAPYSINSTCKSCNIAQCFECSSLKCIQCNGGYLLIGDSLCLNSCGYNEVYNNENKECETIANSGISQNFKLNFVPLPYLIIGFIAFILVLVAYKTHVIIITSFLLAIISTLFVLNIITTILVYQFTIKTNDSILNIVSFILIMIIAVHYSCNTVITLLYCKYLGILKWGILIPSNIITFGILALLCANINGYNSLFDCNSTLFWDYFNKVLKFSLLFDGIAVGVGIFLVFKISFSYYLFYSSIQLIILGVFKIVGSIIWFLWPINKPTQYLGSQSFGKILQEQSFNENLSKNNQIRSEIIQKQNDKQSLKIAYKSQYDVHKNVIKVPNSRIPRGIEQGLFRRNQQSVRKQQQKNQLQSQLSSAAKMHRRFKERQFQIQNIQQKNYQQNYEQKYKMNPSRRNKQEKQIEQKYKEKIEHRRKNNNKNINEQDLQSQKEGQMPNIIFEQQDEEDQEESGTQVDGQEKNRSNYSLGSSQYSRPIHVHAKDNHQSKQNQSEEFSQQNDNEDLCPMNSDDALRVNQQEESARNKKTINIFDQMPRISKPKKINLNKQKKIIENKIIHADLESIHTFEQDEEDNSENQNYLNKFTEQKNKTIPEINQDLVKPSDRFRKTINHMSTINGQKY